MEIVVLSGKGGTGKTTVAMALGEFAKKANMIDCDVDAPNLEMFFRGDIQFEEDFYGEKKAHVNSDKCVQCGICTDKCKFDAIEDGKVNITKCEGCGVCKIVCPYDAVVLEEIKNAEIFVDRYEMKNITRSKMTVGSEGSGKLITKLRKISEENTCEELTIIDGSPGIGCPVISSSTNCNIALIVSEPTLSGLSDLRRICETTKSLGVKTVACINKYDINIDMTEHIKVFCSGNDVEVLGVIPFDRTVMEGINKCKPITDFPESSACKAINKIWLNLKKDLNKNNSNLENLIKDTPKKEEII